MDRENRFQLKLLYVEDDLESRQGILEMLAALDLHGVTISPLFSASNGQDGLELYRQHYPDIIITDIWMPVMNGIDMLTEIRKSGGDPFVIVTSAYSDIDYFLSAIELGIHRYLLKPLQFNDLIFTLEKAVEEIRMRRQLAHTTKKLQALSFELIMNEEKNRKLVAANLHDSIGQGLLLLQMTLERLREKPDDASWDNALQMLTRLITETRDLTVELSPPVLHEMGLYSALEALGEEFQTRHGFKVNLDMEKSFPRLGEKLEIFLYRSARELLMNVLKHGQTVAALVRVALPGHDVLLEVFDHGRGFDPDRNPTARNSFGLFSIEQRVSSLGGRMSVRSAPGSGCQVTVTIPDWKYHQKSDCGGKVCQ